MQDWVSRGSEWFIIAETREQAVLHHESRQRLFGGPHLHQTAAMKHLTIGGTGLSTC